MASVKNGKEREGTRAWGNPPEARLPGQGRETKMKVLWHQGTSILHE